MTEIQIGDVVYLDDEFCTDEDQFRPTLFSSAWFANWCAGDFESEWLLRTRWIVRDYDGEFVTVQGINLADKPYERFYPDELVPTGERIILNDPSRYDRMLL